MAILDWRHGKSSRPRDPQSLSVGTRGGYAEVNNGHNKNEVEDGHESVGHGSIGHDSVGCDTAGCSSTGHDSACPLLTPPAGPSSTGHGSARTPLASLVGRSNTGYYSARTHSTLPVGQSNTGHHSAHMLPTPNDTGTPLTWANPFGVGRRIAAVIRQLRPLPEVEDRYDNAADVV